MNTLPTGEADAGLKQTKLPAAKFELVIILASIAAFAPLATDMYLPAFPSLGKYFGDGGGGLQLSLAAFFAAFSLGQLLFGPLADRFGRKPPLYAGIALFIISSLACVIAPDVKTLVLLRFFQGLGACAGAVIGMAVVRDIFEGREGAKIFSLLAVVGGIAPMAAPTLGGFVLLLSNWKGIFIVLAAMGTLCLLGMHFRLPETVPAKRLSANPLAISRNYWGLLCNGSFMLFTVSMGFGGAGMFAYIAGSPLVFMQGYGVAPWVYGLIFGFNAFGLISAAHLNSMLMTKFDPIKVLRFGIYAQATAGIILLLTAITGAFGFAGILVPLFLYLFFLSLTRPNATVLAMAPFKHCAGTASALMGALQFAIAAGASTVMGLFHSTSAVPMAAAIAFCGITGALTGRLAVRRAQELDMQEMKRQEQELEPPAIAD